MLAKYYSFKVKGGILLYTLLISTICLVILLLMISVAYYNRIERVNFIEYQKKVILSQNVLELITNNTNFLQLSDNQVNDLFKDKFIYRSFYWGLYKCVSLRFDDKYKILNRCFLVGRQLNIDKYFTLLVSDCNNIISISGKSYIEGTVYIPKAKFKSTSLMNSPILNDIKIMNTIFKHSDNKLESINPTLLNIKNSLIYSLFNSDSMSSSTFNIANQDIYNSFYDETKYLNSTKSIHLNNSVIKGNVCIYSNDTITVDSLSTLENVILIAPNIIIKSNFKGAVQCFATNTIIVENNVNLYYPSSLILTPNSQGNNKFISIDSNSYIKGDIILYDSLMLKSFPIVINSNTYIYGNIYSTDLIQLGGNIYGSVSASKLFYRTSYSRYENVLINTNIYSLPKDLYCSGLWKIENKNSIIKYLN